MGRIAIFIGVLGIMLSLPARADYHYASHAGSDEYPYNSWETATDSIQLAIDAAEPGDTVYVGAGTWSQQVQIWDNSLALIGTGSDSTLWENYEADYCIRVYGDSITIVDFSFLSDQSYGNAAVSCLHHGWVDIFNNYFYGFFAAIAGNLGGLISNNFFEYNQHAFSPVAVKGQLIFENNTIYHNYRSWSIFFDDLLQDTSQVIVRKNLFYEGINQGDVFGGYLPPNTDTIYVYNNVIAKKTRAPGPYSYFGLALDLLQFYNNTIDGTFLYHDPYAPSNGIYANTFDSTRYIDNNIVINCDHAMGNHGQIRYSCFYNNVELGPVQFLVGNIFANPMFDDTLDYHLQAFSPCIDAGDPNILDPDGSRSDIGAYGGPAGEYYEYQDLPPRIPDSLQAEVSATNDTIYLSWTYNTEADFNHYQLYRDTISGFEPSVFNQIAQPETSVYIDTDFDTDHGYYYRIAAVDNQGNQSDYSNQLGVAFTGFTESDPNLPRSAVLYQNYPNPFNQNTVIKFYLPDIGYQPAAIQIIIYDILGRRVRSLVDEPLYPGGHEVVWNGTDDAGRALSSGVYFYRLLIGKAELTGPKKLMLVK